MALAFNRIVSSSQAEDTSVPLLERLKFLAIVSAATWTSFSRSALPDLKEQIKAGSERHRAGWLDTHRGRADCISTQVHGIVTRQYELLNGELLPALNRARHPLPAPRAAGRTKQQNWIQDYFFREMMPVLTPIGLDPAHPFPRLFNKSLNFAVELTGPRCLRARLRVRPSCRRRALLPRVIKLPKTGGVAEGPNDFIFPESSVSCMQHVGELFSGMQVLGCHQFRVTRNSDLFVDEEEVKNLRTALAG